MKLLIYFLISTLTLLFWLSILKVGKEGDIKMEDDELEEIARNEYLRKIVERELEKREEEAYRSNNSNSSWFDDDFPSWGNFSGGSSSFGSGGFSGGGGSSGGGGAGRSF